MGFFDIISGIGNAILGTDVSGDDIQTGALDYASQGAYSNAKAIRDINAANIAFTERMANTAHQREVLDLRSAGLNPILSAGGSGAPAPVGNMVAPRPGDVMAGLASTTKDAIKIGSDLQEQQSRVDLNYAAADKADAQVEETNWRTRNLMEQIENTSANTANVRDARKGIQAHSELVDMQRRLKRERLGVDSSAQKFDAYMERVKPVADTIRSFIPLTSGSREGGRRSVPDND